MGLDDGAGGDLGEEGDVGRQSHKVPFRRNRSLFHVQQVAHSLKQVEGNAQRENDVQGSQPQPKGPGKGGNEEIVIFAEAQQGKTGSHARINIGRFSAVFKQPRRGIAHPDDPQQEQQKARIPVGVEYGVGQQEHPPLGFDRFAQLYQPGGCQKKEQKI